MRAEGGGARGRAPGTARWQGPGRGRPSRLVLRCPRSARCRPGRPPSRRPQSRGRAARAGARSARKTAAGPKAALPAACGASLANLREFEEGPTARCLLLLPCSGSRRRAPAVLTATGSTLSGAAPGQGGWAPNSPVQPSRPGHLSQPRGCPEQAAEASSTDSAHAASPRVAGGGRELSAHAGRGDLCSRGQAARGPPGRGDRAERAPWMRSRSDAPARPAAPPPAWPSCLPFGKFRGFSFSSNLGRDPCPSTTAGGRLLACRPRTMVQGSRG